MTYLIGLLNRKSHKLCDEEAQNNARSRHADINTKTYEYANYEQLSIGVGS